MIKKEFHIDYLDSEVIGNVNFDTYERPCGSMSIWGLWLGKEEFELLKNAGGIVGGNMRSENVNLAKTFLNYLKKQTTSHKIS